MTQNGRSHEKNEIPEEEFEVLEAPFWPAPDAEVGEKTLFRRIFYWGTLIAFGIIIFIGVVSSYFGVQWAPLDESFGLVNLVLFLMWNFLTCQSLLCASYFGPGYVPRGWKPADTHHAQKLQWCKVCEGYKGPRSHHCSKCNRCCMKMDHHCPWINNCVGHRNHAHFIRFLIFAIIGCVHAAIMDCLSFYHAIFAGWYMRYGTGSEPIIIVTPVEIILLAMAIALATGVAIALTILLVVQLKYIWRNKNGIEEYIDSKARSRRSAAERRRAEKSEKTASSTSGAEDDDDDDDDDEDITEWVYPYDLGWKRNCLEVLGDVVNGETEGNGTWWPVKPGCDQFTFTLEQLALKRLKRGRAREVLITESFAGTVCASRKFGWKVFFKQPMVDGKPLKVSAGDVLTATRGGSGWLYGYPGSDESNKGWVPMACTNIGKHSEEKEDEQKTEKEEKKEQ